MRGGDARRAPSRAPRAAPSRRARPPRARPADARGRTSSLCSAWRSFGLPCPESSRAWSRAARTRTCSTSASALVSSRRRSLDRGLRTSTSAVCRSVTWRVELGEPRELRAACASCGRSGPGGCRAPGRRAVGAGPLRGQSSRVSFRSRCGGAVGSGLATRPVHGSVRTVLTRVSTVVPAAASVRSQGGGRVREPRPLGGEVGDVDEVGRLARRAARSNSARSRSSDAGWWRRSAVT